MLPFDYDWHFAAMKNSVVKAMFLDMADRDYVLSRLAYGVDLVRLFEKVSIYASDLFPDRLRKT